MRSPDRSVPLAGGVHAVRLRDDLVILDLRTDDYLCLPDCGSLTPTDGQISGRSDMLAHLLDAGLLDEAGTGGRRSLPTLPTQGCPPTSARPDVGDALTVARLWSGRALTRPSVGALAQRAGGRSGRRDPQAAARQVEIFRRLLPFAPWTGECLFQADLLLRFLNLRGLDADWVFGVRTWPFLAHCWLQIDDVCLTDAPDTLVHYRPILVV